MRALCVVALLVICHRLVSANHAVARKQDERAVGTLVDSVFQTASDVVKTAVGVAKQLLPPLEGILSKLEAFITTGTLEFLNGLHVLEAILVDIVDEVLITVLMALSHIKNLVGLIDLFIFTLLKIFLDPILEIVKIITGLDLSTVVDIAEVILELPEHLVGIGVELLKDVFPEVRKLLKGLLDLP